MRILLVTGTYLPSINGVALSIKALRDKLLDKGHEVYVLAPKNGGNGSSDQEKMIYYPSVENPKNEDYPIPLILGVKALRKLYRSGPFDVVHTHHPYHIGAIARFIAKRYGVPLVFTHHTNYDAYVREYLDFLPDKIHENFMGTGVNGFCKKCDVVVVPSEFIKNRLSKRLNYVELVTIPTGIVDKKKMLTKEINIRKKHELGEAKILLCVGRLSFEKNFQMIIKAFAKLPNSFVLVFVGDGPARKELEKLTDGLALTDRIVFAGKVDHRVVGNYYVQADLFVYSSKSETQGLVYLEALSFHLPVVAVRSNAAMEWVNSDVGILTDDDPVSLAEGVISGFEKHSYLKNNLQKQKLLYTDDAMAEKMLSVYRGLINENTKAIS